MKTTYKLHTLLVIVTAFILASSMFIGSNTIGFDAATDPSRNNSFIPSAITVDGNLSTGEWADAAYVEEWYMDADEENTDGNNYMYLTEDADNVYIGLDLCSDTTNNGTDEWGRQVLRAPGRGFARPRAGLDRGERADISFQGQVRWQRCLVYQMMAA